MPFGKHTQLLKMAIEIVDLPTNSMVDLSIVCPLKNGDFPIVYPLNMVISHSLPIKNGDFPIVYPLRMVMFP